MEVLYLIEVIKKIQILAALQTSFVGKDYIDIYRNDFDRDKNNLHSLHSQLHYCQPNIFRRVDSRNFK